MLKYICSTFLSELLPIQLLFCPQKLISSQWLIAIIFSLSLTISNVQLFFHDFVKHCSVAHFGKERLGVLSPKLTVAGKTPISAGSGSCASLSFCALHHQLKALSTSGCSVLSLLIAASFQVWCTQNCVIMGNSLFEVLNFTQLHIEANAVSLLPL